MSGVACCLRGRRRTDAAWRIGFLVAAVAVTVIPSAFAETVVYSDRPNAVEFPPQQAQYVRFLVKATSDGAQPCIDELEVYGADAEQNLALASKGVKASASSSLNGYAAHRIEHLNDGLYGNDNSWIPVAMADEWAQIQLPAAASVSRVVFSRDRNRNFADRMPVVFSVLLSMDGETWTTVSDVTATAGAVVIRQQNASGFSGDVPNPPPPPQRGRAKDTVLSQPPRDHAEQLKLAYLGEEHAWLKTYGRADLSPRLVPYNGRVKQYPHHVLDDRLPLPPLSREPKIDGRFNDDCWNEASRGVARVAYPYDFEAGPLVEIAVTAGWFESGLCLAFDFSQLLSSHVAVLSTADGQGCGVLVCDGKALAFKQYEGGKESSSTPVESACNDSMTRWEVRLPLSLFPACQEKGLRVGLGMGGQHTDRFGRPVQFTFSNVSIAQAGPCSEGTFPVRFAMAESKQSNDSTPIELSGNALELGDGITLAPGESRVISFKATKNDIGPECNLEFTDDQGHEYSLSLLRYDPLERTLNLMSAMAGRFAAKGIDVTKERGQITSFRERQQQLPDSHKPDGTREREAFFEARTAKRDLFLREPDLAPMEDLLFAKRMPFEPSHNYSDLLDAPYRPGGAVATVHIPREGGRFVPERAEVTHLFESGGGIARTPAATFDCGEVYFAYRPSEDGYFHIMRMNADGSNLKQLTDGPFHDFWPCPLPDGGVAVVSTRCHMRFLCWRPQAYVLFRMDSNGGNIAPLSFANLSEWAPSVMRDGRIIWTRSEYQDKGADFGHTLWSIHPDGSKPELVFGNTIIQPNGYANGREVPGTREICCTLISHFGDLNGPIALVDLDKGRFNPKAITSITPEVPWPGMWPSEECFRDAYPIARDYFLCSHAPQCRFELFVIDRFGNRELIYGDPAISCMCPTVFKPQTPPPVLSPLDSTQVAGDYGEFIVRDVYAGISPAVERGKVKYLRVSEEVRANLEVMPDGQYRKDHDPEFQDWYASPVHKVSGPFGWPTYVAKAPHGLVPVAEDGSAYFRAPAGKVLYFQALDGDFNELQRMRSVVQLQPGERRSCIGCHEHRELAPANTGRYVAKGPVEPIRAEWEGQPFSYERVVQPVFDAKCVRCHDATNALGVDLRGDLDPDKVPFSYRTLIAKGYVHYADMQWNAGGCEKIEPLSLGTLKSKLWEVLNAGHHDVSLTRDEMLRVKTWIDLNCPLWPDYINRNERPGGMPKVASRP